MKRLIAAASLSFTSLALAACSGSPPEAKPADPVAEVRTAVARSGSAVETVAAYGAAEAGAGGERSLVAPVEASVAQILVAPGGAVAAGQAVVALTPGPTARLDLGKARSDTATAHAALARAQRLRADGLMSDADVETARAADRVASQTAASLGGRAAALTLRSPVAGTVTSVANAPGDLVAAGVAVAKIAVRGDLRGRFGVEPSVLARLRVGGAVTLRGSGGAAPASARITAIDPLVDPATRLAAVYTTLPAGRGAGEPLAADLALGSATPGVSVPEAALGDDAGHPFVYVVTGGIAHRRAVTTGTVAGGSAEITHGVAAGERVATDGLTGLEDGIKVRDAGPVRK
jgi:RND family efflux transporter MFP subunit